MFGALPGVKARKKRKIRQLHRLGIDHGHILLPDKILLKNPRLVAADKRKISLPVMHALRGFPAADRVQDQMNIGMQLSEPPKKLGQDLVRQRTGRGKVIVVSFRS